MIGVAISAARHTACAQRFPRRLESLFVEVISLPSIPETHIDTSEAQTFSGLWSDCPGLAGHGDASARSALGCVISHGAGFTPARLRSGWGESHRVLMSGDTNAGEGC